MAGVCACVTECERIRIHRLKENLESPVSAGLRMAYDSHSNSTANRSPRCALQDGGRLRHDVLRQPRCRHCSSGGWLLAKSLDDSRSEVQTQGEARDLSV